METPLDLLVLEDGNRDAFERVIAITQIHDSPEHLFLVGPEQSGKTMLLRTRAAEKDLLSTKKVSFHSAKEMTAAVRFDVRDDFFENLGSVGVLLCDDFPAFLEDEEAGLMLCKLMLAERDRLGLDTVFTSRVPLSELDLSACDGLLDQFVQLTVDPLSEEGRREFARRMLEAYAKEGKSPVLDDEAIAYLANEYVASLEEVRLAIKYLMTGSDFGPKDTLSVEAVKSVVAR